jgi:DnaJ family protein A protein 2
MTKDTVLYDLLEVKPDASEAEIKKSYNKLSKLNHPDKHTDPEAKEKATKKFQEINKAKEVLLEKEKRNLYDQIGMDMFKAEAQGAQHNPFGGMGGFPFDMGGMGMPGFPFGMGGMPSQNKQPEDIVEPINVTLEQIYNEQSVDFSYKQKNYCNKCDGEGSKDSKSSKCASCNGQGVKVQVIKMGNMIQQSVGECNNCRGKGKVIDDSNKCDCCSGKGYLVKDKTIQIPLKAGLMHGYKMNLESKGHQMKNNKTNLIIVINEEPNKTYRRNEDDLFVDVELKLYQALFGFDKTITHLDGRKLHISCSGKTDFNMFRKINGEGMRNLKNTKGDLYIKFNIILPNFTSLPADTKTQLKTLLQSFDKNEVQNEGQISKTPNLTKTIMGDCKPEQSEQLYQLLDSLKNNQQKQFNKQRKQRNNMGSNMSDSDMDMGNDENQQQPQCVQQ